MTKPVTPPFIRRYVIGHPGVAEAIDGVVYADHDEARKHAISVGAYVLSYGWVIARKPALKLTERERFIPKKKRA